MAILAQNEKLNIVPGGIIPVVHASQYDVDRVLTFTLYDGLSAASLPTGVTGLIEGTKPDDKGFQYAVTSISGNVVTVVTTKQMTAVKGTVKCKIVLTKDNMVLGTALFFLEVDEAGLDDETDISETDLPFIRDMAETNMLNAEAWAVGTRNGVPVPSTDETYENNSKFYAGEAGDSAESAAESETNAAQSEIVCGSCMRIAGESKDTAVEAAGNAAISETNAAQSEANAKAYADLFFGFLRPLGNITFAELPAASTASAGDWYVITDAFTTTSDFVVGAGVAVPAGANVYMTTNGKWGIIQGSLVGGVKGNAESTYRTGQVNLTYSNLGTAQITDGGTGATTVSGARKSLGLGDNNGDLPITIAQGGTGATTRLNAAKALTNESVALPNYLIGMTNSWGKFGYTSLDQIKKALKLPINILDYIGISVASDTTAVNFWRNIVPIENRTVFLFTPGKSNASGYTSDSNYGYANLEISSGYRNSFGGYSSKIGTLSTTSYKQGGCRKTTSGNFAYYFVGLTPSGTSESHIEFKAITRDNILTRFEVDLVFPAITSSNQGVYIGLII